MKLGATRLAILPFGDRLIAAAVHGDRVETFVVDAENPSEALRAEFDQRRLVVRNVALGVPRTSVTVKPIELPSVDGEVRQMVSFELERHLPFPSEDAAFDFVLLPEEREAPAAGGGRQVVIAAADRRVVDGALRIAEAAKLRPISLTVASHNLPGLIGRRPRRERVVWIHRAGDMTELLFLTGGVIAFSRSLTGADGATTASEIQRSFSLVRWRGCDAVWVSGDEDTGLSSALAYSGAALAEPPYTPHAARLIAAISDSPRGIYELAVAVAAGPRLRPLELLPIAIRPRHLTRAQLTTIGFAAATVLLALGALLAPGFREQRRLANLNAQIARLDPEVRSTESVLQDLERKRRLLGTIQSLETGSIRPLPVLRELTELLPNDAWLTLLSADTKGVELTGQASAAAALIPLLENSPRLERVEFSSPVTRGRDKEQFRIRAAWEGAPGAAVAAAPAPAVIPVPPAIMQPRRPPSAPPPVSPAPPPVSPAR